MIIFSTTVPGATLVTLPLFLYSTLIKADGSFKLISVHKELPPVTGCLTSVVVVALYAEQMNKEMKMLTRNIFTEWCHSEY